MVKGITYILTNDASVQALVGRNNADTKYKAYPNVCPQPEKSPYSVVRISSKVPVECKGMSPNAYVYTYEVISFDESYDTCEAIDEAVVAALSKPSGGSYNSVSFQEIRHINTVDQYVNDYHLHAKVSSFEALVNES